MTHNDSGAGFPWINVFNGNWYKDLKLTTHPFSANDEHNCVGKYCRNMTHAPIEEQNEWNRRLNLRNVLERKAYRIRNEHRCDRYNKRRSNNPEKSENLPPIKTYDEILQQLIEEENLMPMPYHQKIQRLIQHDSSNQLCHYTTCYITAQEVSNAHMKEIQDLEHLLAVKKMRATMFKEHVKNITVKEHVCKREEAIYRLNTTNKLCDALNILVWEYLGFDIQ